MPIPEETTLLMLCLAHIEEQLRQRRAEHDDLVRQMQWLEQERDQLIEDAAQEARRHAAHGR